MQRVQAVVPVILLSTTGALSNHPPSLRSARFPAVLVVDPVKTLSRNGARARPVEREVTLMHSVSFPRDPHRAEAS